MWAALLRGINVSGANRLPMAELRALLAECGFGQVQTYIQSGNALFSAPGSAPQIAAQIQAAIAARYGYEVPVLVLPLADLAAVAAASPFGASDPAKVLVFFFTGAAAGLAPLEELRAPSETIAPGAGVFYLDAPQGLGRSKLVARAEAKLGVGLTARNMRTLDKMLALVPGAAAG